MQDLDILSQLRNERIQVWSLSPITFGSPIDGRSQSDSRHAKKQKQKNKRTKNRQTKTNNRNCSLLNSKVYKEFLYSLHAFAGERRQAVGCWVLILTWQASSGELSKPSPHCK